MESTEIVGLAMMVLVCAMALYILTSTSITRAAVFALAMGGLGIIVYGYRLLRSTP